MRARTGAVAGLLAVLALGFARLGAPSAGGPAAAVPAPGPWRLWQDAQVFMAVDRLLSGGRSRVWLEMYEFGRPDLAARLVAARRAGSDVRVVYDPTVAATLVTARRLRAQGVPARPYPVDSKLHQIDHVKLLIAGSAALAGGMNWGSTSYRNHDYAVEVEDAGAVSRLAQIFLQDWSLAGGTPAPLAGRGAGEGPAVQTFPGDGIRLLIERDLIAARHRIRAEVFAFTDPEVIAELALASRAGVSVEVLLDPNQAVNRPTYALLRSAGVAVRWYRVAAGQKLHAKAGLFDGRLVVGSANWSRSGLGSNHELDLEVVAPAAVTAFNRRFELDWEAAG